MNRDDIIDKDFPHSLFGYDPVSVDAFLDEVIREFDRRDNTLDVIGMEFEKVLSDAMDINKRLLAILKTRGIAVPKDCKVHMMSAKAIRMELERTYLGDVSRDIQDKNVSLEASSSEDELRLEGVGQEDIKEGEQTSEAASEVSSDKKK